MSDAAASPVSRIIESPVKRARDRALCLELRAEKKSYQEIAEEVGISISQVQKHIEAGMRELRKIASEDADTVRRFELMKLDKMEKAMSEMVEAGVLDAVDKTIKVMTHRAKIMGLFAPTEVNLNITAKQVSGEAPKSASQAKAFLRQELGDDF